MDDIILAIVGFIMTILVGALAFFLKRLIAEQGHTKKAIHEQKYHFHAMQLRMSTEYVRRDSFDKSMEEVKVAHNDTRAMLSNLMTQMTTIAVTVARIEERTRERD